MSTPTVVLEGRCIADPELKFTGQGRAFLKFRVATSDSKKDEQTQQWETVRSLFVNVTVFDDAEKLAETLTKGSRVTVAGRLHEREFEHNGEKRRSLEVAFPLVQVQRERQSSGGYQSPAPQQPARDPWASAQGQSAPWGAPSVSDDEVPF